MIKMRYTISLMWLQVIHDHIQINKNKTKVKVGRVLRMEYLGLENCPAHAIKHFLNKLAHMKIV